MLMTVSLECVCVGTVVIAVEITVIPAQGSIWEMVAMVTINPPPPPPQVNGSTVHIQEGGVHLELTVVDTPGFGDIVDNSNWLAVLGLSSTLIGVFSCHSSN